MPELPIKSRQKPTWAQAHHAITAWVDQAGADIGASTAEAASFILSGTVPPPGTYAANVIELAAHRIHEERQSYARSER